MGCTAIHAAAVGAGNPTAASLRLETPTHHPRPDLGGQRSSAGLFGLRLDAFTGNAPQAVEVRAAQTKAVAPRRPVGDQQPRRIGGLTFGARRAMIQARVATGAANFFARAASSMPDEFDGYGLARPSTPAMQTAAAESAARDERGWDALADLAATPEWDRRTLSYGDVETACALD